MTAPLATMATQLRRMADLAEMLNATRHVSGMTMTLHDELRAMFRVRRHRDRFFPGDLFADPAWDMIIDLMAAREAGKRVSVSSLCIAASVPPTTALRWITNLAERGIVSRVGDPDDGRRIYVELTDDAAASFLAWRGSIPMLEATT